MAESKNDLTENKKKRPNKLTNARIKKEIEFLEKMFVGVDDENKKTLINSLIEEAAFLKVACFQAKEELKKEGLTTETVNASQKFVKAHPSTQIYEKYSRQYTAIIHSLIEYLPPKEKEKVSTIEVKLGIKEVTRGARVGQKTIHQNRDRIPPPTPKPQTQKRTH